MTEEKTELNKMPEFKIVLAKPSYLKDSIGILCNLINEARIRFSEDKIEIIEMDAANVCMVHWELLSSCCTITITYNLNSLLWE